MQTSDNMSTPHEVDFDDTLAGLGDVAITIFLSTLSL